MDKKLQRAISQAIKKEEYSYKLYIKAYKKTKIKSSKQLFKKLAQQELKHKKTLKTLNLKQLETKKLRFNVAKKLMLTPLNELNELKNILKSVISREQDAYDSYMKLSGVFSGKPKILFIKLANQEKTHKELIKKEYKRMF